MEVKIESNSVDERNIMTPIKSPQLVDFFLLKPLSGKTIPPPNSTIFGKASNHQPEGQGCHLRSFSFTRWISLEAPGVDRALHVRHVFPATSGRILPGHLHLQRGWISEISDIRDFKLVMVRFTSGMKL